MVTCENYKRTAPGGAGILAWAIGRTKMVVVSESHEIALVEYLEQITSIRCGRARSWEGLDISMHDGARDNCCHVRIARNCTGSIYRPNNEYWKLLRAKIIKEALPGGPGY